MEEQSYQHDPARTALSQTSNEREIIEQCRRTAEALSLHAPDSDLVAQLTRVLAELERVAAYPGTRTLPESDRQRIATVLRETELSLRDIERAEDFKRRIARLVVGDRGVEVADRIKAKVESLRSKYNAPDYRMYHVLENEHRHPHTSPRHDDFPEDDAVGPFIQQLEHEYGEKTERT